jgi:tRNA 2-selenouridine synthase
MSAETLPPSTPEPFLLSGGPLIDVRSPGEFAQGHIPGAINLPLFSDAERAEVGTLYKQQGRNAAVLQGLALVGGRLEQLGRTMLQLQLGSEALRLYCWRGGMRSGAMAWLAGTVGLNTSLLPGGYKAFRRWVLSRFVLPWPLLLLAGRTGGGKTDVLKALDALGAAVIDLEGLAHHRGSSFGALGLPPQPSSEQFENLLAMELLRLGSGRRIWLEAESAQIGRARIPAGLWRQMQDAPLVELRRPAHERVRRLVSVYGDQGREALIEATERISRRLGPQRTALAQAAIAAGDMAAACQQMLEYYDRCYDHELNQRPRAVLLQLDGEGLSDSDVAARLWQWQQQLLHGSETLLA